MSTLSRTSKYVIAIGGTLLVGILSGWITKDAIATWYVTLRKPSFNPPNWVFGPVWTLLYVMMGAAAARVWCRTGTPEVSGALRVYMGQVVLNAAWSIIFFGLHAPLCALVEIVALWACILWCMERFNQVDVMARWLLLPYMLWVSFATVLNASIVALN